PGLETGRGEKRIESSDAVAFLLPQVLDSLEPTLAGGKGGERRQSRYGIGKVGGANRDRRRISGPATRDDAIAYDANLDADALEARRGPPIGPGGGKDQAGQGDSPPRDAAGREEGAGGGPVARDPVGLGTAGTRVDPDAAVRTLHGMPESGERGDRQLHIG